MNVNIQSMWNSLFNLRWRLSPYTWENQYIIHGAWRRNLADVTSATLSTYWLVLTGNALLQCSSAPPRHFLHHRQCRADINAMLKAIFIQSSFKCSECLFFCFVSVLNILIKFYIKHLEHDSISSGGSCHITRKYYSFERKYYWLNQRMNFLDPIDGSIYLVYSMLIVYITIKMSFKYIIKWRKSLNAW